MRWRMISLLPILLLVLVLAACGESDAPKESASGFATTLAPSAPPGIAAPPGTGSGGGSPASREFCDLSRSYVDRSDQLARSGGAPDLFRQIYQSAEEDIRNAYDVAPDEIKANVKVVADAISTLVRALERTNWDFSRLTPEAFAGISAPQFQAAGDKVEAYARDKCGVD